MKILMIILSSPAVNAVYPLHKAIWAKYMHSEPSITSYFLEFHDEKDTIEGDIFYVKGKESTHPGCLNKTLACFKHFAQADYDFIVRSNMSSLWNFPAMLKHIATLPTQDLYSGVIGRCKSIDYASGSGFILSADVLRRLVAAPIHGPNIVDDVDIGFILNKLGIKIKKAERVDILKLHDYKTHTYKNTNYHYRFKWDGMRDKEAVAMMNMMNHIYYGEQLKPM